MKKFINNSKSYSLDEVYDLMNQVNEGGQQNISYTESTKQTNLSLSKKISTVVLAGLISTSGYAIGNSSSNKNFNNPEKIAKVDSEHNLYVEYLNSHSNHGLEDSQIIIEQILSFKSLSNNWDGYGAIPTEIKSCSNAIKLIFKLSPSIINKISSVHPSTNGTVSFVWENNDGERVSFEIGDNNYSFYTKLNNLNPLFFKGLVSDQDLIATLEKEVKKL